MKTIKEIKDGIRVTKIIATRSIKTKQGDTYSGFTARWDSVQDDDPSGDSPSNPLTLSEARIAHLLLAKETDIASYTSAIANGSMSLEDGQRAISETQQRYDHILELYYKQGESQ